MSGLSDRVLSIQQLRGLQDRSDLRGAVRLTIHVALLGGAGWLVAASAGWLVVPAVAALGLVQAALFAPAHETMHQTAFASRRANAVVGWLTSCPSLLNWHFYTAYHLAHHRHTQMQGLDPELTAPTPTSLSGYALRVMGIPFWHLRLQVIRDCWRGDLSAYPYHRRGRCAQDHPQRPGNDGGDDRAARSPPPFCSAGPPPSSTGLAHSFSVSRRYAPISSPNTPAARKIETASPIPARP